MTQETIVNEIRSKLSPLRNDAHAMAFIRRLMGDFQDTKDLCESLRNCVTSTGLQNARPDRNAIDTTKKGIDLPHVNTAYDDIRHILNEHVIHQKALQEVLKEMIDGLDRSNEK